MRRSRINPKGGRQETVSGLVIQIILIFVRIELIFMKIYVDSI